MTLNVRDGYTSSGMWCCVSGWVFADVSKEHSALLMEVWGVGEACVFLGRNQFLEIWLTSWEKTSVLRLQHTHTHTHTYLDCLTSYEMELRFFRNVRITHQMTYHKIPEEINLYRYRWQNLKSRIYFHTHFTCRLSAETQYAEEPA